MTSGSGDAGGADAGSSFYSFVQIDGAGLEVVRRPFGPSESFVMNLTAAVLDPAGNIWALSQVDGFNGSQPALMQLTQYGQVLWSQPFTHGDLFALGPSGGVVLAVDAAGTTLRAFGGDGGLLWSRANSQLDGGGQPLQMAIDPSGAVYAAPAPMGSSITVQVFDPQGQLFGVRVGPEINALYMALGVDPLGTAIIAGYLYDGGIGNLLVRLGP
jgi:streptogramin lyase